MVWDAALNLWGTAMSNNYEKDTTETTQKNLSQEAIDKLIYDVLSSDAGLASMVQGENLSGGFGSSTKTLMAQDFTTKLVGELANITAATTRTGGEVKTTKEGRAVNKIGDFGDKFNEFNIGKNIDDTVICTELHRQGKLSSELYILGGPPSRQVAYHTWKGYHVWATKVVALMQKSERLSNFFLPIVIARYEHLTGIRKNFLGALTVYVGHPICYMIGRVIDFGGNYGRTKQHA